MNPRQSEAAPEDELFTQVTEAERAEASAAAFKVRESERRRAPFFSGGILLLLCLASLCAPLLAVHSPEQFFLQQANSAPSSEFFFGTDPLGRDLYSLMFYALRTSLAVGLISFAVSVFLAVLVGVLSALSLDLADRALQRLLELLQSIPQILLFMLLCTIFPAHSLLTLGLIIGGCSFFGLARLIRSEVKTLLTADFVLAAHGLGSSRVSIALTHLLPNVLPGLSFALTSTLSSAIAAEAVLSFLGLGLPPEILSLGGLLSVSQRAFLMHSWWCVLIPGLFLIVLLGSVTALGSYFSARTVRPCSYL